MDRALLVEGVALYLPLVSALLVGILGAWHQRVWVAVLVSVVWHAVMLPVVNLWMVSAGGWGFPSEGSLVLGMPVGLYLGWVVLWGSLATFLQFFIRRLGWLMATVVTVVLSLVIDLLLMPMLSPLLELEEGWLIGEALLILLVLVPSLVMNYAVIEYHWVEFRALFVSLTFILLATFLLPFMVESSALSAAMERIGERGRIENGMFVVVLLFLAVPGVSGVIEFATRGGGTPIPYDPPVKLVTTGVYAYCRNPMQLSMCFCLLVWGWMIGSWVPVVVAVMSVVYSLGIANWSEGEDMQRRFGAEWGSYRKGRRPYMVRLTPVSYPEGQLYISQTCGICGQLRLWLKKQNPEALEMRDAEEHHEILSRIRYERGDVVEDGVRAVAEAFQHLDVRFAYIGWVMKMPMMDRVLQAALDASGAEARACRS